MLVKPRRPSLQGDNLLNDEWNELPTYKDTFDQMSYGGFDYKS